MLVTLQRFVFMLHISKAQFIAPPPHASIRKSLAVNGVACYMYAHTLFTERNPKTILQTHDI